MRRKKKSELYNKLVIIFLFHLYRALSFSVCEIFPRIFHSRRRKINFPWAIFSAPWSLGRHHENYGRHFKVSPFKQFFLSLESIFYSACCSYKKLSINYDCNLRDTRYQHSGEKDLWNLFWWHQLRCWKTFRPKPGAARLDFFCRKVSFSNAIHDSFVHCK